jgi:hypothetical protein
MRFRRKAVGKNSLLLGQVQTLNDTEPRISMSPSTSFVSLACLLFTGAPIIIGVRNPMKASFYSCQWVPVEYASNQYTAQFVFSMGLRRAPPLREILYIAASDNPSMRTKAFSFFLDNISNDYSDYDPKKFRDLAFVPAILGLEKVLAKPFEVRNLTS